MQTIFFKKKLQIFIKGEETCPKPEKEPVLGVLGVPYRSFESQVTLSHATIFSLPEARSAFE